MSATTTGVRGRARARTDRPQLPHPGRCLVLGVLNVTPDSFSDGGHHVGVDDAVRHGLHLVADGADLVDVGGESTRPGARRVPQATEAARVLPVVRALVDAGVAVSVDTMRASVAEAAVAAGAVLVNDVSGGLADPAMAGCVADLGVPFVVMHWRGHSDRMQERARYGDLAADVTRELRIRLDALVAAGVPEDRLIVDPGLGFAKTAAQSWELLRELDTVRALGRPVLLGASRKGFLAEVAGARRHGDDASSRDAATVALTAVAAKAGIFAVRVHDAAGSASAVRVAAVLGIEGMAQCLHSRPHRFGDEQFQ